MIGAWRLSQYTREYIEIECSKCERKGRFRTDKLREQYGGISMPDLLNKLVTDCKGKSLNYPCVARYAENSIIREGSSE
jgi:hypothetical protein